jgi:hypothetical protein
MKRTALGVAVAILLLAVVSLSTSCKPPAGSGGSGPASSDENVLWRSELFDYAMDTLLNRMEEYHSAEMRQQTINRLDQWVRKQKPLEGWQPDPVIAGVSEELRAAGEQIVALAEQFAQVQQGKTLESLDRIPGDLRAAGQQLKQLGARLSLVETLQLGSEMAGLADQLEEAIDNTPSDQASQTVRDLITQISLEEFARRGNELRVFAQYVDPTLLEFPAHESLSFQEAVWLRNVATWAGGEELDDPVKPAVALFDWVVKNVQLVRDTSSEEQNAPIRVLQKPWETLLFGRGTAMDRVWLFVLLARQMNMDAALLGLTGDDESSTTLARLWSVGVLIEGEIYLFEPVLGLPIPKPGSWELTEKGLTVQPATLAEAAADETVLRQLDILKEGDYSVSAEDLQRVVALVEAGPTYLSQRMQMVENRLTGDQKIVLTTAPTAQMERFKQCRHVVDARMWPLPYQTLWQEIRLGMNRLQWQQAMLTPFGMPEQTPFLWKARTYHFKGQFTGKPSATEFYQSARLSNFDLATAELAPELDQLWRKMKVDASYWLGLLVAHTGNYRAAEDYLKTRVLLADPGGEWQDGASYNLARIYEAIDNIPLATALYAANTDSPDTHGNLIRARWLRKLPGVEDQAVEAEADEKEAPETEKEPEEQNTLEKKQSAEEQKPEANQESPKTTEPDSDEER